MAKPRNEQTSKKVGTKASAILSDPKSSAKAKSVAASALTQRPAHKSRNEETSKKVGTKASEILSDPKSSAKAKSVAASVLTQRPDHTKNKKK